LKVWHAPQPLETNTAFPCAGLPAAAAFVVVAAVAAGAVVAAAAAAVVVAAVVAGVVAGATTVTVRVTVRFPPAVSWPIAHPTSPAGTSATIGPDLDTKPALDAKKDNLQLAAFLRESIVSPNAYISSGYPKGVMPQNFGTTLTKTQLADLVAFITAGGK